MVVEHNYVLSLDEIKAVRFRCLHCRTSLSCRVNETITFPAVCPCCLKTLYDSALDTGDSGTIHALPRVLKDLLDLQAKKQKNGKETTGFEILLEIDAPRT